MCRLDTGRSHPYTDQHSSYVCSCTQRWTLPAKRCGPPGTSSAPPSSGTLHEHLEHLDGTRSPTTTLMEYRRDPRQFLFFVILLLLINSPEPQNPGFNTRSRYEEVIDREWEQLDILNRTRWGDFDPHEKKWLNITGLREKDAFTWDALADVKSRARERMKGILGQRAQDWLQGTTEVGSQEMVYRNISGFVQGEWVRSPLSRIRFPIDMLNATGNVPEFAPLAEFDRNLTGTHGTARLHLTELDGRQKTDENRTISELKAKMVIGDSDSWGDNWWEFNLNGVHYPDFGGAVLTTTSER